MRKEEEIKAELEKIKRAGDNEYASPSVRAGHWEDCLEWVLGGKRGN